MNTALQLVDSEFCQRAEDEKVIQQALRILERRMFTRGPRLCSAQEVRDYLKLRMAGHEHEVFAVLFLDARHRLLAFEELFFGTIDGATVYPRQVVKRALYWNCAALILTHNHPSGCTDPSQADRFLTERLKEALALVDVRVLDHFIVGEGQPLSLAEYGWM